MTRPGSRQALVSVGDHEHPGPRRRARTAHPFAILGVALSSALSAIVPAVASAADDASLRERLAAASPERGQELFRVCRACHSIDEGAAHTIGPNLWGVVGRRVATAEGYDRYTPAMTSFGGIWSPERLDRYLRQPMAEIDGTAMVFPGIPSDADRADLIAWLNRSSPAPADFAPKHVAPEGRGDAEDASGGEAETPRPATPPDLGILVPGEGAEETHAYCTACHSERIVAQQGLTRPDWEELLAQMVEENGMTPIEEPDLGRVLAYLAAHYGPDRPNFPRH